MLSAPSSASLIVVTVAQFGHGDHSERYVYSPGSPSQIHGLSDPHPGWRVDFNVSLPSFEPLIAGTRNLVDFALSSAVAGGPRLLFVSSISTLFSKAFQFVLGHAVSHKKRQDARRRYRLPNRSRLGPNMQPASAMARASGLPNRCFGGRGRKRALARRLCVWGS